MPRITQTDAAGTSSGGTLHEDLFRDDDVVGSSDRAFGLVIGAVCGLVGGMRLILSHNNAWWWIGAAAVLAFFAWFLPAALGPFNRVWLRLGMLLYKVVNPVVMSLLYCVAILPVGALMRLCGKDPLRLRREPDTASYWIMRDPPGPAPETMRDQF